MSPDLIALAGLNFKFKNRHAGQECFILATGPSISRQNLATLEGKLCIAVSHFFLHPDLDAIRPRYHVIAPYHPPFDFEAAQKLFSGLQQAYANIRPVYFLGYRPYEYSTYDFLRRHPELTDLDVYYINYSESPQIDETNCRLPATWDICGNPFAPRTVVYIAIQLAAYMGCTPIYLLGCDHDYLSDVKRVTDHHFYREEDGVSDAEHLSSFTLERWFEEYYYRWKQYRLMRESLEGRGIQVFNATDGGMLDVFPRVLLSQVLAEP